MVPDLELGIRSLFRRPWALAIAVIAGFVLQDWIKPLTPGVASGDPWPGLLSAAVVLAAALLATLKPAQRAIGVDLVATLRDVE